MLFLKRISCKNHAVFVSNYGAGYVDDLLRDAFIGFKITEIIGSILQAATDVVDFYLPVCCSDRLSISRVPLPRLRLSKTMDVFSSATIRLCTLPLPSTLR